MIIVLRATLKTPEFCLKLNRAYHKQYYITKDKLLTLPQDRQFDFCETLSFGRFSRRVVKLIDMFSIIHQFQMLLIHMNFMDDIHQLVGFLNTLVQEFQGRGHNLVDFIDQCSASITTIEMSLKLLGKCQCIF